jgi:restriction system protein
MTMWLVRAGKSGEKEMCALQNNVALIGWEELPDLRLCSDRENLLTLLQNVYPSERRRTHTSWQNQIWPIRHTMQIGDLVALPLKSRAAIAFGIVAGDYAHRDDLLDEPQHTRPVNWIAQVPRAEFDQDILYSFGAFMTVCRITRNDAEQRIRIILEQGTWPAAAEMQPALRVPCNLRAPSNSPVPLTVVDLMKKSNSLIRERIGQRFKGHRLAELVAALLEVYGYHARLSPPGVDGGVDILAGRGPLGMDPPRLVVQVKSQETKLDVRILRELSGVMNRFQAEQGLLVGWGGFNQAVRAEALGDYFRMRLWDADDLVRAVETEYGRLPEAIRAEIPLKQIWALAPEKANDGKAAFGKAADGKAPDGKEPDGEAPDGKAGNGMPTESPAMRPPSLRPNLVSPATPLNDRTVAAIGPGGTAHSTSAAVLNVA